MNSVTHTSLTSAISKAGEITLPLEIRERLGVRAGDRIEFGIQDGVVTLLAAPISDDPFAQFVGCLPGFTSMEEIIAWERDLRDPDGEYL